MHIERPLEMKYFKEVSSCDSNAILARMPPDQCLVVLCRYLSPSISAFLYISSLTHL